MATIRNKIEYYSLWKKLALGNRVRMFDNIDELLQTDYRGPISIRYKEPTSQFKAFHIPYDKVLDKVTEFIKQGGSRHLFTFNESAPDDKLLIQGEAQYLVGGLHLTYSTIKGFSMKKAMEYPKHAVGLEAKCLLEHYMNPKSYDMIQELFEEYPDDVIEFGVYSVNLGCMKNLNSIIWEIRAY